MAQQVSKFELHLGGTNGRVSTFPDFIPEGFVSGSYAYQLGDNVLRTEEFSNNSSIVIHQDAQLYRGNHLFKVKLHVKGPTDPIDTPFFWFFDVRVNFGSVIYSRKIKQNTPAQQFHDVHIPCGDLVAAGPSFVETCQLVFRVRLGLL